MLQRVASNAYSWWWASHIRTKQSKWLEQNLQDMEEKVSSMLEIIDDDGDSFAQRANMYYRRRPELLCIVEETYRAYRALAERYDQLSKELQSANRTIASVFPDQVPFAMDEEDEENLSLASTSSSSPDKPGGSKPSVPKAPFPKKEFRSQSMLSFRKGQLTKAFSSGRVAAPPSSGLTKDEAIDEVDKLQKEILGKQTEWEYMKNSYEQAYKKLCEIEDQITEKQKRVCNLQDEFDVGSVIDDNEARILMATRVLKSCRESLVKLQEKHEQSTEETRVESRRIKHVNQAFEALRNKFNSPQTDQQEKLKDVSPTADVENTVYELESVEKEKQYLELLRKEIEEKLEVSSNSGLTMSQLAEKIDGLVQRVVNLETAVFSENALVSRLKSDADKVQARVTSLEEDKEALVEGSDVTNNRMTELEGELGRVKDLLKTIIDQNNSLKTQFAEASCNINHLSVKLQAVKKDEEVENIGFSEEAKTRVDAKPDREMEEEHIELVLGDSSALKDKDSESSNKFDVDSEKNPERMEEDKAEKKSLSQTASSIPDTEIAELETEDEEELPNWKKLYLSGVDDREKILLDEYSSVLRHCKEVKKKLKEVDQKNRDGFFELALQIRELKNALASRDEEIQSLRRKSNFLGENKDRNSVELEEPQLVTSPDSTLTDSIQTSPVAVDRGEKVVPNKMGGTVSQSRPVLTVEDKIRSDIDDLLEENLAFWLRFSTSLHQIQKYQTSVQDLKAELSTLREKKKQEGSGKDEPLNSEARPIYSHLREIKTELTLWLENNAVLKDEVQGRYSSLCNIQEEVAKLSDASRHSGEAELNGYQAAKFQGELLNMKQENKKVSAELKAGFDRVKQLKHEVEKVMTNLEKELAASASTNQHSGSRNGRPRIPLRSFLFGIKLKNKWQQKGPSMFACGHPTLQRQHSYLTEPTEPPR